MEQANKYRVTISKKAADMLISHAAFLAQVSEDAAERLTQEFEVAANSLEVMPQRCPWLMDDSIPKNCYRYLLFEKRYALVFQVIGNTVFVDYVLDSRRDNHLYFM